MATVIKRHRDEKGRFAKCEESIPLDIEGKWHMEKQRDYPDNMVSIFCENLTLAESRVLIKMVHQWVMEKSPDQISGLTYKMERQTW